MHHQVHDIRFASALACVLLSAAACVTQVDEGEPAVAAGGAGGSASDPTGTESSVAPSPSTTLPAPGTSMGPTQAPPSPTASAPGTAPAPMPAPTTPAPVPSPVGEGGSGAMPSETGGAPPTPEPTPTVTSPNGGSPSGGNGGQGGTAVIPDPPDPPVTDGTELFFDDFDDGDAAGWVADVADGNDVVGDWQVVPGETGFVYQQATQYGDATWAFAGDPTWTDQFLEADVAFLSTSDASASTVGEDGFIYFVLRRGLRAGSEDDYNYVFLEFRSDGQFRVRQRFEGSSTTVADWNNLGFLAMAGQWHKIGMKAQGSTLTIYYNGFEILDGMLDPGLSAGQIGFAVIDSTVAIDNVKVTAP